MYFVILGSYHSVSAYTTLQVIKNYVFLQPIVHKPLG